MTDTTSYPVVTLALLQPVPWRPFRGGRRGSHDLPPQPPGTTLVFQINEQFVAAPAGAVKATSRLVADAIAVAVVSLHRRTVVTTVTLPSRWRHTQFSIEAAYDCQVTDAALVLRFGCWDVQPHLWRYLAEDPKVRILAATADPVDYDEFQLRLSAHAVARNRISPPYIPGMVCGLVHLTVDVRYGPPEAAPTVGDPNDSPNGHTGRAPQDYIWDG